MNHHLYPTIVSMLTPTALTRLTGQPITAVDCLPLQATYNKSGSRLQVVQTNHGQGPELVLKQISAAWDWQMRATEDRRGRAVQVWRAGLLDRLPPHLVHGILACAQDGAGWAILMQNLAAAMLPFSPLSRADLEVSLDGMAAMHATFFEAPELALPELGLCHLGQTYTLFAPPTGHHEIGGSDEVPQRILEGWDLFPTMVEPEVADMILALLAEPQPLCTALAQFPLTLVHGDWRHANQGLLRDNDQTRVLLLDWQLATAAPPVVDLARFLIANSPLLPVSKEETIALYRQRLAHYLGPRFADDWWQPQLELGLLGGFLQDGWAVALKASHWHVGASAREQWQADLEWWSAQVRVARRWLETI